MGSSASGTIFPAIRAFSASALTQVELTEFCDQSTTTLAERSSSELILPMKSRSVLSSSFSSRHTLRLCALKAACSRSAACRSFWL